MHRSNSHANDATDSRNASPASQILARNIPTNMSVLDLERYFGRFGTIQSIKQSFCPRLRESNAIREKDAELAQKMGQLQPFVAVFPQACMHGANSHILGQPDTFLTIVTFASTDGIRNASNTLGSLLRVPKVKFTGLTQNSLKFAS